METRKKCTKCKKRLTSSNFFKDNSKKDKYTSSCRLCLKKVYVDNYEKNSPRLILYSKKRYLENKGKIATKAREYRLKTLIEVHDLLGNKCNRCGEKNKKILNIDHVKGNGGNDRRVFGGNYVQYYRKIIQSTLNKKNEYQLLCCNCNQIEALEKGFRTTIWP